MRFSGCNSRTFNLQAILRGTADNLQVLPRREEFSRLTTKHPVL